MERRRDTPTRSRLDDLDEKYDERLNNLSSAYSNYAKRTTRILATLAAVLLISGIVTGYLVAQNSERADEIQNQRYQSVLTSCMSQNRRHDRTIAELKLLVNRISDPREKARAERNQAGTIALIEALVPKQDCPRVARKAVHPPHKAPGG